jgi:hypothetical protein
MRNWKNVIKIDITETDRGWEVDGTDSSLCPKVILVLSLLNF